MGAKQMSNSIYTVFADGTISKAHRYIPMRVHFNPRTGDRILVRLDRVGGTVTEYLHVVTKMWHDITALRETIARFDNEAAA